VAAPTGLSGAFRSRWERFDGRSRLAGVDLARGLAVVGMLAAHLLVIPAFEFDDPRTWIDVVNGRSSILFATLAGVSIALVTGGRTPLRGADRARASARLATRAAVVWVLGIALIFTGVPVYVILPAYGILFLLAIPFLGLRARTLFVIAAAVALVMPWVQAQADGWAIWGSSFGDELAAMIGWHYPFPVWIAFLLAGLALGRCDLRSGTVAVFAVAAGTVLAVTAYALAATAPATSGSATIDAVWTADAHSSGVLEVVGSGGFALAVIGLCLLVCRTPLRWAAVPLRAVGAMPLTAYTVQLVVWALVAGLVLGDTGDLGGFRDLDPFWPLTLGLIIGCCAWTFLVGRGPLEALIERASTWIAPANPRK
jgi:uncharacterized membrane protein YeiB